MRTINVTEGEDFSLSRVDAARLRTAAERLTIQLKPSFTLMSERSGKFRLVNVVGTVDLGAGVVIQVTPKVEAGHNWTKAVVSLLTGAEEVDLAGEREAGASQVHNRLLDALSYAYLQRLERAFRQEGPVVLMELVSGELPYLQGRLDSTKWARSALWRPHIFPVSRTQLVQDNPFTRALIAVANILADVTSNERTKNGLRRLGRDLGVGHTRGVGIDAGIASRKLPEQWSAYKPAWSLAISIISKSSLFGPTGQQVGLGLAIEAWPLLETLLQRTLQGVERIGKQHGREFSHRMQGAVGVLKPRASGPNSHRSFSCEPDGRLFEDGHIVANFEAKYSIFDGVRPNRDHTFQALATGAACGSRISILVYPNSFPPMIWEVMGFDGKPKYLVALGLDLFKWHPHGIGEVRGQMVLDVLDELMSGSLRSMGTAT